ncbi:MAG: ABC transporter ATP-binding protein [Anaerolineae bacterium]
MEAIRCEGISRSFGTKVAVDSVDLVVQRGEVFAFLGPNGAGKTTTVRMLGGLLRPTSGRAWVLGYDVSTASNEIRRRIGVLTETPALYDSLTARENLAFFAHLHGLDATKAQSRIQHLLERFGLAKAADRPTGGYSKGMRQRLAIARAILHEPELLFLDEPTSGLDPEAALDVREMIQTLSRQAGRTIFLCTHNLDEAQRLCQRVGVIEGGLLRAVGRPEELARRFWDGVWVNMDLGGPAGDRVLQQLRAAGADQCERTNSGVRVRVPSRERIPSIVRALVASETPIYGVTPKEWSLADLYFRIQQESSGARGEGTDG